MSTISGQFQLGRLETTVDAMRTNSDVFTAFVKMDSQEVRVLYGVLIQQ